MSIKDKIKINQEVKYLGMKYIVTDVTESYVSMVRPGGSQEISVMAGSNRFNAIFPNIMADNKRPLTFDSEVTVKVDSFNKGKIKLDEDDTVIYAEKSMYNDLFNKYGQDTTEFSGSKEAENEIIKDIKNDKTGVAKLFFTTYAYQKNAVKFEFWSMVDVVNSCNDNDRPASVTESLINFYKASLSDDSDATEMEMKNLAKLLPLKYTAEALTCICQFDWENDIDLIVSQKKVLQILKDCETMSINEETDVLEELD